MSTFLPPDEPGPNRAPILEFCQWAMSNLATNTPRGIFAEYIVAVALGVTDKPRVEWDAADLHYRGHSRCIPKHWRFGNFTVTG